MRYCLLRYHLCNKWNSEKPNRKTRERCVRTSTLHIENILMWHYANPQNIFFSFFFPFKKGLIEPWMTFLEAELDSEGLESSIELTLWRKLPLLFFVVAEKAKFNREKMGRHKNLSSYFPYFRIWLGFPVQSLQLDGDIRLSGQFASSQKHFNPVWLCARYNAVLRCRYKGSVWSFWFHVLSVMFLSKFYLYFGLLKQPFYLVHFSRWVVILVNGSRGEG